MIINLSNKLPELQAFFDGYTPDNKGEILLDIAGICQEIDGYTLVSKYSLDPEEQLKDKSLEAYTDFAAEASRYALNGRSIRSLQIADFPIFWLSGLSEKHDSYHWGQSFFFLRQLLIDQPSFFPSDEKIHIILPQSYGACASWLSSIFQDTLGISPQIYPLSQQKNLLVRWAWVYLKLLIRYVSFMLKTPIKKYQDRARKLNPEQHSNIFLTQDPIFITGKRDWDQDLSLIFKKSKELVPQSVFLPLIRSFEQLHFFDWSLSDKNIIQKFPRFFQLISLVSQVFICELRIFFAPDKSFTFQGKEIPALLIKTELRLAIENCWIFFNLIWLKNYFSSFPGAASIFYSDEFYCQGRAISFAKSSSLNPQLKSYGVQHGVFFPGHTVYCLKDDELLPEDSATNNGLPLPDKFLVWGNFFREYFFSNNNLPESFIENVGNYNYIAQKAPEQQIPASLPKKSIDILWCTTLWVHAINEYKVIEEALLHSGVQYKLCIRLHPARHISKDQLKSLLDSRIYERVSFDSNTYLQDAIIQRDLIICTGFSTSFVDALMAKKQTCRILSNMTGDGFKNLAQISTLHNVRTPKEFTQVLMSLKTPQDEALSDLDELSYLQSDRWNKLLSQQPKNSKIPR